MVARLVCLTFLSLFLFSCSSSVDDCVEAELKNTYIRYMPKGDLGEVQCRRQIFVNEETGKMVEFVGMIHIADGDFYKEVQTILDESDLVLMEGVSGSTSLSLFDLHLRYTMSFMQRTASLLNLSQQHFSLKDNGNWRNADWTLKEFKEENGFGQSALQLISLPFTVVLGEPSVFLSRLSVGFGQNLTWPWAESVQSSYRASLFEGIGKQSRDVELQDSIYKGIIDGRNKSLLKHLDIALAEEEVKRVVIPWGAAHLPSLEQEVLKKGFVKKDETWLRAICSSDIADHGGRDEIVIPYIFRNVTYLREQKETAFLLDSLYFYRSESYNVNELLWGLGGAYKSSKETLAIHLLPKLFEKPLFFSYEENAKKSQWRFLYFFKIENEK